MYENSQDRSPAVTGCRCRSGRQAAPPAARWPKAPMWPPVRITRPLVSTDTGARQPRAWCRLDACGVLREIAAEQRREIRHRRPLPCEAEHAAGGRRVFVDDGARSERDLADGIGGRARLHAVCRTHRALQCAHGCGPIVRRRRHRRAAQFSVCVDAPAHPLQPSRARRPKRFSFTFPKGLASSTAVRPSRPRHQPTYEIVRLTLRCC